MDSTGGALAGCTWGRGDAVHDQEDNVTSTFIKRAAVIAASATCAVATTALTVPASAAPLEAPSAYVVVQKGTGTAQAVNAVRAAGGVVIQEWPQIGVVIASADDDRFDNIARTRPGIVEAGPTRNMHAYQAPSAVVPDGVPTGVGKGTGRGDDTKEPLNANQWDMRLINADKAHRYTDGSRNVTVGVLDSGIEADHPDLANNVDPRQSVSCIERGVPNTDPKAWQPTTSSHGTHVSGTIAAARNGVGIVGVAPNVRLASVKVVDDDGFIYPEYAICGFIWAADKGMEVTNNSYYVDPYNLWCRSKKDERAAILSVERAIKYSEKKNVVNVAASGNSNWDLSKTITDTTSPNNGSEEPTTRVYEPGDCTNMPTEVSNTVSVSSVGPTSKKSSFSNFGKGTIDVTAPGGDSRVPANTPDANGRILSTVLDGKWGYSQGTSMASPHVAGVVALLRSAEPYLDAKQSLKALNKDADPLVCPKLYDSNGDGVADAVCEGGRTGSGFYGSGLVDSLDAVLP